MQVAAGELGPAAALYEEALLENPDDWLALQAYLDCLLPRSAAAGSGCAAAAGGGVVAGLGPLTSALAALELGSSSADSASPQVFRLNLGRLAMRIGE